MSACPYPAALCEVEHLADAGQERAPHVLPGRGFHWALLQRHGRRPLAIYGRALLEAHNRCALGATWSHILVYETASGCFAVSLRHTPCGAEQADWADGWLCETADSVRSSIAAHDPLWSLPLPAEAWDDAKWNRLCAATEAPDVQAAWTGLLAAVFGRPARQDRAA